MPIIAPLYIHIITNGYLFEAYKTSYASELEIADGDVVLGGNDDDISECKPSTSSNDKDDDNENSRFKGKLVLVQNGPCELEEQAMVLGKKGASGVVFFSSQEMDPRKVPFFNVSIPIATLSSFSGHELVSILKNKKKDETIHLHFDGNARVFKSSAAKKMADSTSIGPTMELDLKPSLAAIGTDVYSTLPHYLGGWGTLSGTSMASPYIAGTIALLKEAFGKDVSTSVIHERLMNYARLLESRREDWAENPLRQGSGLLQGTLCDGVLTIS